MRTSTIFTTSSIAALLLLISACSKSPSGAVKNDPTLEPSPRGTATNNETVTPGTGPAGEQKASISWSNDWSIFVNELSEKVAKDNNYVYNVDEAFNGKTVEWTGKVGEIKRPNAAEDLASITLSMKPERLTFMLGAVTLERLTLKPTTGEWETWKSISVNDTVIFRTTLDKGTIPPECVLTKLDMAGANEGKVIAWINTKGGSCLKVQK
jgi:hypothetical protein